MENWKPIKGYPNYEVSDLGRVRSIEHETTATRYGKPYTIKRNARIIKPLARRHGYLAVCLYFEGGRKQESIHRLVAEAFCEHPIGKNEVNHKNEVKTDNRACNLEWVSHQENCVYGTFQDRKRAKAVNGKRSKPVNQYSLDGAYIQTFPSLAEAARNGYSASNICKHIQGHKNYTHAYGYKWEYADTVS